MKKKSYLKNRTDAFGYAFEGLSASFREAHLQIHLLALVSVVSAGFYFNVSRLEWCALIVCSALVIALELLNSALERLCDTVHPERHPNIKFVKDVSAAAVLMMCIAAIAVGVIVFLPYFKSI